MSVVDFRNIKDKTAPVPEFLAPLAIHTAQMHILVNGKNDGFDAHFSRDGKKWWSMWGGKTDPRMPYEMLPSETFFVRIATKDGETIKSLSLVFEAILETRGFRGTGETLVGHVTKSTGANKKAVDIPVALLDANGDLNLWIANSEKEPLVIGGWLAHNFSGRERFGGMSVGYNADGGFSGPTVPAKKSGLYTFTTSKDEPGEHQYVFHFGEIRFH